MDIRIKKFFPNLSQAIWMGSFILVIPFLIGIEQYGYFAKLYSIPSILAGIIDSYYLSTSSEKDFFNYQSLKKPLMRLINYINIMIIILLLLILIGFKLNLQTNLLASLAIFNSLFLRWNTTFIFHRVRKETILKDSTIFEILNISFYFFAFSIFFILVKNGLLKSDYLFLIPCIIISISGTIMFYYSQFKIRNLIQKDLKIKEQNKNVQKNFNFIFKIIFFRSYEDIFISIMPLIFFDIFGSAIAGEARIAISIMKGISKIFPHRYDLFIYRELNNKDYLKEFFKDAKGFISTFIFLFLSLILFFSLLKIEFFQIIYKNYILTSWSLFIFSAPFFAVLASITPYLNKLNLNFNFIWIMPLSISYIISFVFASLNLASFSFLLSNIFILFFLKTKLNRHFSIK